MYVIFIFRRKRYTLYKQLDENTSLHHYISNNYLIYNKSNILYLKNLLLNILISI